MIRRAALAFVLLAASAAWADTEFFGMFVQGQRIGLVTSTRVEQPDGTTRTLSSTKIGANLLGQGMQMSISGESLTLKGRLLRQTYDIETGGRSQKVTAEFGDKQVNVVKVADGQTTNKQVDIPAGAVLIDDPTFGLTGKGMPVVGTKMSFYVFDPTVLNLIKNDAEFMGKREVESEGKKYSGHLLRIKDPRANSDVYLDDSGNAILVVGIFGITMRPLSREEALGKTGYVPSIDLASLSRIVPDKPINKPGSLKSLTLRITGGTFGRLKNDGYWQTIARTERGLSITIKPPKARGGVALKDLKKNQVKFINPALYLPSNDAMMKSAANKAASGAKDGWDAALRITKYVHKVMRPDASIAMLRDAKEVWKTKVGVCRDYAILTATLMRAVGIPTKIVTGAVYSQDGFYYHAWVEAWDGHLWIALDPTLNGGTADATHIKFTEGDPETAFVTFMLDGAKISVVSEQR